MDYGFDEEAGRASEALAGYMDASDALYQIFRAYVASGFTEAQAFELVKSMLAGAIAKAH